MPSLIRRIAPWPGFVGALLTLFATACDPTAPQDPNNQKPLPSEVSLMASVSSLTASAVSWNEIDLTWPSSPSASGYQVLRSTTGATGTYTVIAATFPNVGNYADKGVSPSTQYCYEVRSFKNVGRSTTFGAVSSAACATTLPSPINAPSQIDAVPQGSRVLVKWRDNSDNEDGFSIYGVSVASSANVSVPANTVSAYVNSVPVEQQWCFRVTAFNAVASMTSTTDCTIVPAGPTDLSSSVMDAQSITLHWIDRSAFEDGYKVSRSVQGGVWTDIATLPANAESYQDFAVSVDVTYTYRVQALKDGGYSDVSNDASSLIPTSLPAAPSDLFAAYSLAGDTRMFYLGISWVDASANEAGFRIEFDDGISGWAPYADVPANGTTYFQLMGIEDYAPSGCFRVIAYNLLGSSAPSNIACADPTGVIQQIISGYNAVTGVAPPNIPVRPVKGRKTKQVGQTREHRDR